MKILVTGGAGTVGGAVARDLLEAGHSVRILDRAVPGKQLRARCEIVYADLTDRLAILRAVEGCEAIAHLAAIPNPSNGLDLELFAPNVLGTQYLLAAAEAHDIGRVALASSGSIYGFPFQKNDDIGPQYLPLDVAHPIVNQDVYALSKQCNELTAAMYTRRTGMATTCLRLSKVMNFERHNRWMRRWLERAAQHKDSDLWSYIDVRDAARAFRLALENVNEGHHVLLLAARDLWGEGDLKTRICEHYPELAPFLENGFDYARYGFWDTRPAQELLGWDSRFHWRDALNDQNTQT